MKVYDRRVGLPLFTLCVLLALTGQTWPLNPLVQRNANANGAVPVECEQGLTPAPSPRIDVAEIRREMVLTAATMAAPPSRSLRGELEAVQTALVQNDRPSFDLHLANAKGLLKNYPTGAERNLAQDVVGVFDDAARVWDAQFESPFFAPGTDAYARASRYPGYEDAVRRQLLMDDADHRFYPAAESRDFLARISAQRLGPLGIRATQTAARTTREATPRPQPSNVTTTTTVARNTPRRTTPRRTRSVARHAATSAASHSPERAAPAPAAAAPAPAAPPPASPSVSTPVPSAVSTALPASEVPPAPATSAPAGYNPSTTDTAPQTIPASTTSASDTTASQATTNAIQPPERRSVVIPALLILIGLGVLIVLFRASR